MSTTTIDPDAVCPESFLDEYLGGQLHGAVGLLPMQWPDATPARRFALERVMDHLRRLAVPIRESDLADVTELRNAVLYGAASHLYLLAINRGMEGEGFYAQHRAYEKRFEVELENLRPTIATIARGEDGTLIPYRGATRSIGLVRR